MKNSIDFPQIFTELQNTLGYKGNADQPAIIVSGTWTRTGDVKIESIRAGFEHNLFEGMFFGVRVQIDLPEVVIGEDDDITEQNWKSSIEQAFSGVKISLNIL